MLPPPSSSASTSLTITNPLVLYRALLSTRRINPDPAQHRLALQLQKLYFRLKDYQPDVEYRWRLERAVKLGRRTAGPSTVSSVAVDHEVIEERTAVDEKGRRLKRPWWKSSDASGTAMTRTVPLQDSAMEIDSPQGMLLYGEVGRGKSMLLDLLYDSLPTTKKHRWHFNTFMLDIFRRLELARIEKSLDTTQSTGFGVSDHEHVVLGLARETMETSPILFLDEFQLPDRVAGRLVNGFLMAFFHLGGVLVASSNRMPDELAKAQGVEFSKMTRGIGDSGMWHRILKNMSQGQRAARTDFGVFVEVLKRRCEVWEMEGQRDWRREDTFAGSTALTQEEKELERSLLEEAGVTVMDLDETDEITRVAAGAGEGAGSSIENTSSTSADTPVHYHVQTLPNGESEDLTRELQRLNPTEDWTPTKLSVYSRSLIIPVTSPSKGIAVVSFNSVCASNLGPADYISICSTFHTLVITSVPVLTLLLKNEARRFITLLDACYEARCRLLISAAAPPDRLFFPETRTKSGMVGGMLDDGNSSDSIDSEAFSEMYQDSTAPFRPNVSVYDDVSSSPTMSLHRSGLRSVLADEDADFGPTYGNGRGHGPSSSTNFTDDEQPPAPQGFDELEKRQGPDFTQTGALVGEDEKFAYKRARSRLWEMCGRKWWEERHDRDPQEWWIPVRSEGRFWEKTTRSAVVDDAVLDRVRATTMGREGMTTTTATATASSTSHDGSSRVRVDEKLFRHGASPFRTASEPPPKFGWQHAWGMMTWGKKAGEWGKGVDGDRRKENQETLSREEDKSPRRQT